MTVLVAPAEGGAQTFGIRRSWLGYLFMPAIIGAALIALYFWLDSKTLDSIERRRLSIDFISQATQKHIELVLVSTALVLLSAIPVGIILTRPFARPITGPANAVFNIGQAVPSVGVIALAAIWWTIGFWPSIVALVAYSSLPVLRNTMVGLQQVDESVIDSARGMGMTKFETLMKVELPLAVPLILAGVRTALIINVGTATLVVFINGGGLGQIITTGIVQGRPTMTIAGSVIVACLALTIDYIAGIIENVLRPRGL
jgi:osmoprotectant transport system permease protein